MRRSHLIVALMMLGIGFWLSPGCAGACTCAPPPNTQAALVEADAVFAGRLSRMVYLDDPQRGEPRVRLTFTVTDRWKGPQTQTIVMQSVINKMSCEGYFWEEGEDYLVFASIRPNGMLGVSLCSGTTELRNARADLRALGPGLPPLADPVPLAQPDRPVWLWIALAAGVAGIAMTVMTVRRRGQT